MLSRLPYRAAFLTTAALSGLFAQAPTATMVGTVVDTSGAVIAGAKLDVRSVTKNETQVSFSDQKGEFTIPNLAPDTYEVVVSRDGFRTLHQRDLVLQMDQTARMQFRLEVGSIATTVEVTASVPLINTENGAKGEVMVTQEIVEMPLDGRDFTDLSLVTPGVLPAVAGGQGSSFNINGARSDNTNFAIDGFNDQNSRTGGAQARPNIDALEEFKMQTSGYPAELGRLAGGVMNMVLKTGTNQLHGTLFYFARNDIFDARNFFDVDKSSLERNQFGGTVSGPLLAPKLYNGRNRTFFLFSWESYRQTNGANRLGILPTDTEKLGNFTGFAPVKDPLNKNAAFPGNQIPASRLDPIALKAQAFYPAVNRPGQVNNYLANIDTGNNWDSDVIKLDERVSDKDAISFRFLKRYNRNSNPFNGSDTGTFGDTVHSHQTLAGLSATHTFTPTILNEARFGFMRTTSHEISNLAGTDYNLQFGLPSPGNPKLIGFPRFSITNYEVLGTGANLPVEYTVNNLEWTDVLTWVKGRHLMKFGADVLRTQFFNPAYDNNRGTFNFNGGWTGEPYADFLLGYMNSDSHRIGTTDNYLLSTNYSAFAQDDWKIAERLTLSLGLRYELPKPPVDKYGRWTNFIPEINKLVLASDKTLQGTGIAFTDATKIATAAQLGLPDSLVYTRHDDFAPRVGIAWRPFGGNATVIRGGYGIFYGSTLQNPARNSLANVFPFSVSQTFNKKTTDPTYLTLQNPFPGAPNLLGVTTNVNGYELHAKTPSSQSWNLTLEREIGRQSALEVDYVGSKGTHLGRQYNINQPFRSADTAPNFPYPYPAYGTMNYYGFNANSSYNSGSVVFRRRFTSGIFYRFSYSYSKSIDDTSYLSAASTGGYLGAQNVRNLHGDRGRSDWDLGHAFMMAFSWDLPCKHNPLLRGWQLSGNGHAYTGTPFTPQLSNVNLNLGEANRPNRIAKGTVSNPTADMWYSTAAFPVVPDGSYAFGNSGRNILDGPGTIALNTMLARNFTVREKNRIQFRWEVFDFFNHPNLGIPNVNVNQPNAGTITTTTTDGRTMQFGLRYMF